MRRAFQAIRSDRPDERWPSLFRSLWPAYRRWYSRDGLAARPTYLACEQAMRGHMPELLPIYERLVELAGGEDLSARFLSLYGPGPFLTGCSQLCSAGESPLLVRNYDYDPMLWDAVFMRTQWNGRAVMAMIDCAWGVLDGINDEGLAVALAFGGRPVVGTGFGAPIILRYLLEVCSTTGDAIECLRAVPSHMAYNVTLLDRGGRASTVFIGPDRALRVLDRPYSANHQARVEWPEYERATHSLEREAMLASMLEGPSPDEDSLVRRFLQPPLHAADFAAGWGTLYTAVHDPAAGRTRIIWPDREMTRTIDDFSEASIDLVFGDAA
jgi:predicted choloylglycine hydrolase